MAGTTNTSEGLPVLNKHNDQDTGGLPILNVKKKDAGAGPTLSPSASSQKPVQTAPSVGTSVSESKVVTANYKNNSLTPKDVDDKPLGFQIGPTPEQLSHAINNKGKNLNQWSNSASDNYVKSLVSQHQQVQKQLAKLDATPNSGAVGDMEGMVKRKEDRDKLTNAEQYFRGQIQKEYEVKKQKLVPELSEMLKGQVDDSEFDPETHKLKPISVQWVARHVDGIMNQKNDPAVNAAVSGDVDKKERTYEDLTKDVVDQLNLIPIQKKQAEFTKDYFDKNPAMKDAHNAVSEVNEYFSKSNFDDVKAKVNVDRDKAFIQTKDKYYGQDGIFQKNQDYVGIQQKYAQLVSDGKMTEDVAKKQMQAEIKENPNLKKIDQSFQTELRRIQEKTQQEYKNYIVSGLKGRYPNLTIYKDGSIGVASLSQEKYTKLLNDYHEGMADVAKKMGSESNEAFQKQANEKAKNQGAFLGSAISATNELMSGLTKMVFNKTGWGGDRVRNFESQEIAAPQVSQSDVAATWNWKGVESLVNPNFYLSGIGGMVPVIAGGAATAIATEGTGVPDYVGWLANAGLFTAQSSLSTYNNLLGSKDKDGNQLTEADAAHFAADQAEKDFLPNVLMMAITSGTLLKAKNIIKPTIAATIGKALANTAATQPFFTWQGYNEYATMLEAQGKTTDFSDYLQSKDFRDNLVNGIALGGAFSLAHAPGQYLKSMNNWTKLVHASEGEFKNLLSQNYALGKEMSGDGNYLRDALKMHVFNIDPEGLNDEGKRQLTDLKNTLLYSVNLDKNIRTGNLDKGNANDIYQAHHLALADQHDYLAEQAAKEGNKSLSDIYKDKAKDYREQAKAAANGEAKYHYLISDEGHPIFLSDKSLDVLEKDGKIAAWMKDETIQGVHANDDPEFASRYKDFVEAKNESTVEGKDVLDHTTALIEQNKEKLGPFYFQAKANPEDFLNTVSESVKEDESNAREQYGNDIVDLAKVLFPITEKEGGQNATAKGQGPQREGDQQTGEQEHSRTSSPRNEGQEPETDRIDRGKDSEGEKVIPMGAESEAAPLPQEYKPDFFSPEEKEKFETLDDAGKDKMIDDKRTELKEATISSPIKTESDEKAKEAERRQGDVLTPQEEGGGGQINAPAETPPSTPEEPKVGIAHEVKKEREAESGVKAPERGKGLSSEEGVQRGRDLIKEGADPEKTMQEFEKDGLISADRISIARAKLEELAKNTQAAIKKFGRSSKQADAAREIESNWLKRIQPMQAEWAEAGRRQQGATEIETGSFSGFEKSFEKATDRPMTEEEKKTAQELIDKVAELTERQGKLEEKIKELTAAPTPEEKEQQSIKEKARKTAQKIREKAKLNRPGMFMAATPASLVWDGAVEIVASTVQGLGTIADAVQRGIEHIKASDWYKGLSDSRQKQAIREFSEFHKEEPEVLTPEEKKIKRLEKELEDLKAGIAKKKSPKSEDSERARELREQIKDAREDMGLSASKSDKPLTPEEKEEEDQRQTKKLASKFLDKKDNEFTEQDAKDIWNHVAENYLNKGSDVPDAVVNTSIDLGLSVEQILNAMATPKGGKELSNEMWEVQNEKRKAINSAKYFVANADKGGLSKALDKVPSVFFTIKTYGHGTVGNITHAGPNIFRPSTWAAYWPNVIKSFDLAYGSKANYEKSIFILQNKPNFSQWIKSGLACDPNRIYDEYQLMAKPEKKTKLGRGVQWLTDTGTRGFSGLTFMRYDMAEMLYNKASDAAKADPDFRELVAELVNHATGHSDAFKNSGKVGKALKVISFAPGLEASRWQRMIIDPAKAVKTYATWNNRTPAEKAAAKITAQSAGEKIALYGVLLAANAGLLSALGSKQRVNLTDPTQSDWLRFKFHGKTLDVSGNMFSPYRLLSTLTEWGYKANFGRAKDVIRKPGEQEGKEIVKQLRYKESPLASDVTDIFSGTDAMGNVLPWSKIKPQRGAHKLTWDELIGQETLPIPIQAGIEAYHSSMEKKGMSKSMINGILNGVLLFGIEGATGAKYQDDYSLEKKK